MFPEEIRFKDILLCLLELEVKILNNSFMISLCQTPVANDKELNLKFAREYIEETVSTGSQLIALPEMFNCPYSKEYFGSYAEEFPQGQTIKMLSDLARKHSVYLVGGSIPEKEDNRLYNTSFVFGPEGQLLAKHRKIHLFDIDIPGQISFKESETLSSGETITIFETPFCRIGVAICYDIRFPELTRLMALKGIQLLVLPGAFNMITGPAHWDLTMRARALDNQIFVAAVSPARDVAGGYVAYGHSIVVDPWGNVLAEADETPTIVTTVIDLKQLKLVREQLPLLKHRRPQIY